MSIDLTCERSAKDSLLKATLEMIGEKGTYNTSIREIAARADVNSAAISYYFGSKDKLVEEALNLFYKEIEGIFRLLATCDKPAIERIRLFSIELVKYINKYPGFFKNEVAVHLLEGSKNKVAEDRMKFQVQAIVEVLSEVLGDEKKEIILLKGIQFLSSLIYPQLWGKGSFKAMFGDKDYFNVMEIYVEELIQSIC